MRFERDAIASYNVTSRSIWETRLRLPFSATVSSLPPPFRPRSLFARPSLTDDDHDDHPFSSCCRKASVSHPQYGRSSSPNEPERGEQTARLGLESWCRYLYTSVSRSSSNDSFESSEIRTTRSPNLHVQRRDAQLLAAGRHVLSRQHGSVGRGLVAISLDLHATRNTADRFAATGITQVSLWTS